MMDQRQDRGAGRARLIRLADSRDRGGCNSRARWELGLCVSAASFTTTSEGSALAAPAPPGRACFTGHPVLTIGYTPTYRPRRISWRQFEVRSCCECTLLRGTRRAVPFHFESPAFPSRAASISSFIASRAPFFPFPFRGKASLKLSSGAIICKTVRRSRLCFLLVEITSCGGGGGGVCSCVAHVLCTHTHIHALTRATVLVTGRQCTYRFTESDSRWSSNDPRDGQRPESRR